MKLKTKQDQVADLLRERIVTGDYVRGQRLKQLEVAADFGVSVTPVREAFRMLEAEGYLVGDANKGAVIPFLDYHQVQEIFGLRMNLECDLVRHFMTNPDAKVIEQARRVQDQCAEAVHRADQLAVRRLNYKFHFVFYEAADRPQTLSFVRVLWARYPFHSLQSIDERPSDRMLGEHAEFLDQVARDDPAGAAETMGLHIRQGWQEYTSWSLRMEAEVQRSVG